MKAFICVSLLFINSYADDIVISAEKISKNLNLSTNNISYISSRDIQRNGWINLSQVLQSQPGVYMTGFGTGNNVQSLRMNGTQRGYSKIIIDSVEYNDPTDIDNSFQINQLDLSNIESIEVLKGSQSTIYGSDAIGGVIKITTKQSSKKDDSIILSRGSANMNSVQVLSNGVSNESIKYSLSSLAQASDGISSFNANRTTNAEKDSYSKISLMGNLEAKVQTLTLKFQTHFLKSSTEIDNFGSDLRDEDQSNFELMNYFLSVEKKVLDGQLKNELSLSQTNIHRDSQGQYPTTNKGREQKINLTTTHYLNSKITNLYGLEYQTLKSSDIFDFSNQITKSNSNLSFFAASTTLLHKTSLDLSTRFENNSSFSEKMTYKIGLSQKFGDFSVSSNFATGYKSPTLYQLNAGSSNLDLKPIDSVYKDLIVKYQNESVLYTLTLYQYDFENQIIYENNRYENINKSLIRGIENSINVNIAENFSLNTSSTFQNTQNKDSQKYLDRSPRLLFKSSATYTNFASYNLEHIYIGDRNDSGRLPSYSLFNFTTAYKSFKLTLNNILDKQYEDIRKYGTYGRSFVLSYKLAL